MPDRRTQPPQPFTPAHRGGVPRLVVNLAREWRTALDRDLAHLDLTSQQAVLLVLLMPRPISPNQLVAELGTDTAGMTRLVDRLERKGYLRRRTHPEDRRAILVELTPEGRALVPRVAAIITNARTQLLRGFSPAETDHLERLLQRLLDNLGPEARKAP